MPYLYVKKCSSDFQNDFLCIHLSVDALLNSMEPFLRISYNISINGNVLSSRFNSAIKFQSKSSRLYELLGFILEKAFQSDFFPNIGP